MFFQMRRSNGSGGGGGGLWRHSWHCGSRNAAPEVPPPGHDDHLAGSSHSLGPPLATPLPNTLGSGSGSGTGAWSSRGELASATVGAEMVEPAPEPLVPPSIYHQPPPPQQKHHPHHQWSSSSCSSSPMMMMTMMRPAQVARTAPPTPVRELGSGGGLMCGEEAAEGDTARYSSAPLLDRLPVHNNHWHPTNNNARDWSQEEDEDEDYDDDDERKRRLGQSADPNQNSNNNTLSRNITREQPSETVLQKFRKSFSLRFYKKGGGGGSQEEAEPEKEQESASEDHNDLNPSPHSTLQRKLDPPTYNPPEKFRFGPLVWRSSKERKKGKKAARNAKCNSGDSGIQLEMGGRGGGDSSESHDTDDHLPHDEDNLDDVDSPPIVRRRGTGTGEENRRPSRPTSDVINQILIDKLKADLQARGIIKKGGNGSNVRRTHSDLGGQRLYNWEARRSCRRMFSSPSPVKNRPHVSPRKANLTEAQIRHLKRIRGRPSQLRRSISQPIGINELSPLMQRKPPASRLIHVLSEDERGGGATSDDELMSDSESSVTSLTDRRKTFEQVMDERVVILAEAVWDHVAMEPEELGFRAGDVIEVLDTLDKDWWWGATGQHTGWFPSAFVRLRVSQEDTVEDCLMSDGSDVKSVRRRVSVSLLSNDQVRTRVVTELVNTERDFVKVLKDVQQGYLAECRKRVDMFSEEQIQTIFSNLEELLNFQIEFLQDLEAAIDWEVPHRSCIADIFLKHHSSFKIYSDYCNSHPMAIATLQDLYQQNSYRKFFEACRLMRGLIEIPLDGYLLTPVQRICKYPLQLAELLKYTKTDHSDYYKLNEALDAMRGVAVHINERKRRMESLEKLAAWQQRVEGWEGEDLIETSSQLIHQGEAVRITTGLWTTNITLFLFDHQLVYCKKDILKRNTYVYKGRIQMDTSEVINLNDGKDPALGVSVRHGIKVYSCVRDKWLLFCLRSSTEKAEWLEAFARERRMVAQDLRDGLDFGPAARHLASRHLVPTSTSRHHHLRPPLKPNSKKRTRRGSGSARSMTLNNSSTSLLRQQQQQQQHNSTSLGKKVGTWFTFGANKKSRALGRASTLQTVVHPS